MEQKEVGYIHKQPGCLKVKFPGEEIVVYKDGPRRFQVQKDGVTMNLPTRILTYLDSFKPVGFRPRGELRRLSEAFITRIRQKISEIGNGDDRWIDLAAYEVEYYYLTAKVFTIDILGLHVDYDDETQTEIVPYEDIQIEELDAILDIVERFERWQS